MILYNCHCAFNCPLVVEYVICACTVRVVPSERGTVLAPYTSCLSLRLPFRFSLFRHTHTGHPFLPSAGPASRRPSRFLEAIFGFYTARCLHWVRRRREGGKEGGREGGREGTNEESGMMGMAFVLSPSSSEIVFSSSSPSLG